MANLKQDVLNNLGNEKYYSELELARLANDPNISHKVKVESMAMTLKELGKIDVATQLVEKYFQEQPQQQTTNVQSGQSHSE